MVVSPSIPTTSATGYHAISPLNNNNNNNNNNTGTATSPINTGSRPSLAAESLRRQISQDSNSNINNNIAKMLLLHQTNNVKVGEIQRYTITYTPIHDRILPPPHALHLRIKNTEPIPMRAAYLHGPYVLYCSAKSTKFDPWTPVVDAREEGGYPEYEPNLRPGGVWECQLPIPRTMRNRVMEKERSRRLSGAGGTGTGMIGQKKEKKDDEGDEEESITWVVEVISQMIFSSSAKIHFDLLLARDEKSLAHYQHGPTDEGSFSQAISFKVQNTDQLWQTPAFPGESNRIEGKSEPDEKQKPKINKGPKKVHLVIITHGLHSNTGADMLFMKEKIDASSQRAVESARKKRMEARRQRKADREDLEKTQSELRLEANEPEPPEQPKPGDDNDKDEEDDEDDDDDEEQVVTRGFFHNVCRTERGIKYLGKRLARYVLALTYPHRPFPASLKTRKERTGGTFDILHHHSADKEAEKEKKKKPEKPQKYKVTSISFVGHSLGGLVQTYAVAYIHAHSPEYFRDVEPVNFIALATPFLGLSNENPIYVRFALDFGLVGKTGQDLGLTWRPPNMAASAFAALTNNSSSQASQETTMTGTKPLLRILPTGPAKDVLKMFRNRTVYANVVNDGIVPLRTSCLLFLDWKGLGRVEKARRQNDGPVGQVSGLVGWGWGQLISGQGDRTHKRKWSTSSKDNKLRPEPINTDHHGEEITEAPKTNESMHSTSSSTSSDPSKKDPNPFSSILTFFRPHAGKKKQAQILQRSQALPESPPSPQSAEIKITEAPDDDEEAGTLTPTQQQHQSPTEAAASETTISDPSKSIEVDLDGKATGRATAGDHGEADEYEILAAPPRTTLLEAAGDVLNPPTPSLEYLINPESRPRTIFHDRVYHPEDMPPMPARSRRTLSRSNSTFMNGSEHPSSSNSTPPETSDPALSRSNMKVEEKIARAYHNGISWRKVLVRLEPDAHNNIIVRREFSNAYGWPVVKHLVDTHFEDTIEAKMADDLEDSRERAYDADIGDKVHRGHEVKHAELRRDVNHPMPGIRETRTGLAPPTSSSGGNGTTSDNENDRVKFTRRSSMGFFRRSSTYKRNRSHSPAGGERNMDDSGVWSDAAFEVSDSDDEPHETDAQRLARQTREEEVRRTKTIDSFLGKKSGAGTGPVSNVFVEHKPRSGSSLSPPSSSSGGGITGGGGVGGEIKDLGHGGVGTAMLGLRKSSSTAVDTLSKIHRASVESQRRETVAVGGGGDGGSDQVGARGDEEVIGEGGEGMDHQGIAKRIARMSFSGGGGLNDGVKGVQSEAKDLKKKE